MRTMTVGDVICVDNSATKSLRTPPDRYPLNKGSFRRSVQQCSRIRLDPSLD
jgi:uncharacterized protein (DUF362 family)